MSGGEAQAVTEKMKTKEGLAEGNNLSGAKQIEAHDSGCSFPKLRAAEKGSRSFESWQPPHLLNAAEQGDPRCTAYRPILEATLQEDLARVSRSALFYRRLKLT